MKLLSFFFLIQLIDRGYPFSFFSPLPAGRESSTLLSFLASYEQVIFLAFCQRSHLSSFFFFPVRSYIPFSFVLPPRPNAKVRRSFFFSSGYSKWNSSLKTPFVFYLQDSGEQSALPTSPVLYLVRDRFFFFSSL